MEHTIEVVLGKHSRAVLRVLRALLRAEKPVTLYWVEKESGVYEAKIVLRRLKEAGIVEELDNYKPKRYKINRRNRLVREIEDFLMRIGYLTP
mgnify:CR=1 FL=1